MSFHIFSNYSNLAFCDVYPLTRAMREQLYRSLTPVSTAATMASSPERTRAGAILPAAQVPPSMQSADLLKVGVSTSTHPTKTATHMPKYAS